VLSSGVDRCVIPALLEKFHVVVVYVNVVAIIPFEGFFDLLVAIRGLIFRRGLRLLRVRHRDYRLVLLDPHRLHCGRSHDCLVLVRLGLVLGDHLIWLLVLSWDLLNHLGAWFVIRVVGTLLLIQDQDVLDWCLDVLRGYLGVCDWRWGNLLCSEANEKPDMAAVIGVVEPSLGVFGVGLEVVV